MRILALLIITIALFAAACNRQTTQKTYDVLIDTDLGGDPDDIQSLHRLLHYSDILKIKGIVSTPCIDLVDHPWDTIPHDYLIKEWVKRVDLDYLRSKGHTNLMEEKAVLDVVKNGVQTPGWPTNERRSDGSDWIIKTAKRYSKENPLWVLVWGSITSVAQALHDAPEIAKNIRIYYIGSTNTLHDTLSYNYMHLFMNEKYAPLWWIESGLLPKWSRETMRGVYQGGNQEGEWHNQGFVDMNIRGHGSTHNGLFNEKCGDAFPLATSPKATLKEGDSPTFLYLLSPVLGGVGNPDDPTSESWGGTYQLFNKEKYPNYYVDLDTTSEACQATINKWRVQFMSDWKNRWDWYD